jgi:hypothetical protein
MILLDYNHASETFGSWNSDIYTEPNGVTHHGFGTVSVMAQTYIARYWETDDQAYANPYVTSYTNTASGHVDVSSHEWQGVWVTNCTRVTYWLDVGNCDCISACMTQSG